MDMIEVRQKVKLAREQMAAGDYKKAQTTLKGVDHPKAEELRVTITENLGDVQGGNFPLGRVVGLFVMMVVFVIGGVFFVTRGSANNEPAVVIPTLAVIPTSDCNPAKVADWWGSTNIELDTFIRDASAASRTIPGERLDDRLEALTTMRREYEQPPACAPIEVRIAAGDISSAMTQTIGILQSWADTSNAQTVANTMPTVQQAIRNEMDIIQRGIIRD